MVTMYIKGLSVDNNAKTPILMLQSEDEQHSLPIWIGAMEAMSISLALSGQKISRPLTHDLLLTSVNALGGKIQCVEITSFENGTFFASLVILQNTNLFKIDCRPSDGVTLAFKMGVAIMVHPDVLRDAASAEQRQDATSFRLLNTEEAEDKIPTKPTPVIRHKVQHITIKPVERAQAQNVTTATSLPKNDTDMEKLLKSLEPPSKLKM